MSDKMFKKLPAVLQTTAIKNFFDNTVEQLFSKSNVESVQGFIGSPRRDATKLEGKYLVEPTVTRRFYGLSPTVNTINPTTGKSEDLIFYDEFIDTIKSYGVDVHDHNKLFSENFSTYVPPINVDKLINYSEYYWSPAGPTSIDVTGTLENPIDIDRDIIGEKYFTPPGGKKFRNGMVVTFTGEYVIPQSKVGVTYIVSGVGNEIKLLPKNDNYSVTWVNIGDAEWDNEASTPDNELGDINRYHSSGNITGISIENAGIGYVNPQFLIYDDTIVDSNALVQTPSPVGGDTYANVLSLSGNVVGIESIVDLESVNDISSEYTYLDTLIETYRVGDLATANITLAGNGSISSATFDSGNEGSNYTGEIKIALYDTAVNINADAAAMGTGNVFTNTIVLSSNTINVKVGQAVTGNGISGIVKQVIPEDIPAAVTPKIVLENYIEISLSNLAANPLLTFKGRDFQATVETDYEVKTPGAVSILNTQAIVGVNPNDSSDYYLIGGVKGWDQDFDGDGVGDAIFGGNVADSEPDYILQERGAKNKNVWSRVNFWHHKDNFLDAGDTLPNRKLRANRPIIEFDNKLELYNHGTSSIGSVISASTDNTYAELDSSALGTTIDGAPMESSTFIFPGEIPEVAKYVYTAIQEGGVLRIKKVGDPVLNPPNTADGDLLFVPLEVKKNQTVQISNGLLNIGKEYFWTGTEWKLAQSKYDINQAPLFNLYDVDGVYLGDNGVYPNSTFSGNKIFGYATKLPEQNNNLVLSPSKDSELDFKLVYKQFKSSSEIVFENYQNTQNYTYQPVGSSSFIDIDGYLYYKLDKKVPEYHAFWQSIDTPSIQRIVTTYEYNQIHKDNQVKSMSIGCIPELNSNKSSGYDIDISINGKPVDSFTYGTNKAGFIDFTSSAELNANDFIEISAYSKSGLILLDSNSKFELPISFGQNTKNLDVNHISEPEYLTHFSNYISNQEIFSGNVLGANNFDSTAKDPKFATDIIQTNQDVTLGAFLIDDQPHNIIDSLRFCGNEYIKYKNRIKSEIDKYYTNGFNEKLSIRDVAEEVIKRVITYKVGKLVFNRTYVLPFGDTYKEETFTVGLDQTEFVLKTSADLNKLENSLLLYKNEILMVVDQDYTITSFSPITINFTASANLQTSDKISARIFDAERDSAQCPPTPSTMGLYPLFKPEKTTDTSFITPLDVIVGHDGSITEQYGDARDDILLEIENRIFNAAKREFRYANSLPEFNENIVRGGAFRTNTGFNHKDFGDLTHHYFTAWILNNQLDAVANEFYDEDNEWTWNYGNGDIPGHWKGLYCHYYDTIRPNTHPWEMLGFTEKPLWWDQEYYLYETDDLGRQNPYIDYSSNNIKLWEDLEHGIIRQGPRENVKGQLFKINNPYRRIGLHEIIPVDDQGNLISPFNLFSTESTSKVETWVNDVGTHDTDYSYRTDSFLEIDGVNVSFDTSNVYVSSKAIPNHVISDLNENIAGHRELNGEPVEYQDISYSIPRKDLNLLTVSESKMVNHGAIAVLVNGLPLYNLNRGDSYADNKEWYYNQVKHEERYNLGHIQSEEGLLHYHTISSEVLGLNNWETDSHSPIVGWAFDGLPIYGPYGYKEYHANGIIKNSEISSINSSWVLREGNRISGPGGAHTGAFIQDYRFDATLESTVGHADRWNKRYGCTPDSPNTPIHFYVVTVDDNLNPAFPYHVGGGIENIDSWAGNYFSGSQNTGMLDSIIVRDAGGLYTNATVVIDGDGSGATATATFVPYNANTADSGKILGITITNAGQNYTYATATISGDGVRAKLNVVISNKDNSRNRSAINDSATSSISSVLNVTTEKTTGISREWQFGDLAPVEYVWRKSEGYPFAVAEALALAKPGRFATVFGEPTKLFRPAINKSQLFNKDTKKRWKFYDPAQFNIHGDYTAENDFISNVGYTQFIHSWLSFQGLDTKIDFADKLRTVNIKLAHRMAGFIDKDTMSLRTDRYSTSGNASSLIIPKENINVSVHSSNYKSRNFYSGLIIEKTSSGYKIRGYDKSNGYFTYYETNKNGPRENITVGGSPADFIDWTSNTNYKRGTIVSYLGRFYEAKLNLSEGTEFSKNNWNPLPSLPQIGGARGVLYQEHTGKILRAYYDKEFKTAEGLFDFIIGLGLYQKEEGFGFGEYDTEIGDTRDWAYAGKQFLFWTTGKWEIGNTLELSPMASKIKFNAPRGFIAKINRIDREQFCIVNQSGAIINPEDCSISRLDNSIEISPPEGEQIYGLLVFTKEIEHAMVIDNVTEFNDLIFDEVLNQKHTRLKFKGNRTKNWTGKFVSEGFIIDGDELIPNLDNLAETLGRYHELGFVPVQKQVYDASRALFGYQERSYLKELDLNDDQQYDFYKGMVQNKGTSTSITQIARNNSVLEGNIAVYDEWALKAGEFGDLNNNKNIELKLYKTDIKSEPQLVTLQLPESVTYSVSSIDVIQARYGYRIPPAIELPKPNSVGIQATARAILTGEGYIGKVEIVEPGSGYTVGSTGINEIGASVIAANVTTSAEETKLGFGIAESNSSINNGYVDLTGTSSSLTIKDHISDSDNIVLSIGNGVDTLTISDFVDAVNSNAILNVNITAQSITSDAGESLFLYGKDFEIIDGAGASLKNGRYQPIQRYALVTTLSEESQLSTSESDIRVALDNVVIPNVVTDENGIVTSTNWTFTPGHFETVNPDNVYPRPDTSVNRSSDDDTFSLTGTSANVALTTEIIPENLVVNPDNTYKFISITVDNQIVKNVKDELPDPVTGTTRSGVVYSFITDPVSGNATHIHFPDISNLPNKSLTESYNPPIGYSAGTSQREIVKSITPDTNIEVIVKSAIQFDNSFKDDVPGKQISVKVLVKEAIAVKLSPRRTYEITKLDNASDTILIDIDDKDRFLKKPKGISNDQLWLTTNKFNHNIITDPEYPTIRHAGYVSSANVNYQAFDLASIPDLFSNDILIKPDTNDLIHIAKSENKDWNVYRLNRVPATQSFIYRNPEGEVNLYTDFSLFNYLDTNQIGESNTGKYLDYFLTIKNSSISDNVVIWNNEDIVQATAFGIQDFKAPRMIEARIASIAPQTLAGIANIEPERGSPISGLTLNPVNNSNTVIVTGTNFTNIENLDYISLVDNVPTVRNYRASITSGAASNVLTFNTAQVSNIVVSNGGEGYTDVPTATITASPEGDNATAVVNVTGGIQGITVVDNGDVSVAEVRIEGGGGSGASATTFITNASIVGYNIVSAGSGYAITDTVSITGTNTTPATANITVDPNGSITLVVPQNLGAGYGSDAEVTITSAGGAGAVIEPILKGNVGVTMVSEGSKYTSRPTITVFTDSLTNPPATATATMNASISSISVTNAGSGYNFSSPPTLTLSGGSPTTPATTTLNVINGLEFVSVGSHIKLTGSANANLEFRIGTPITTDEANTLSNVKLALSSRYKVTSVNTNYGSFTIQANVFLDDTVVDNLDVAGYSVNESISFNPNTKYQVTNKTPTSFRIERPNTAQQQAVSGLHWNTSKVTTTTNHGLSVGDIIRVSTNTIRGKFAIDDITGGNSFVIPAKFVPGFTSGDIIKEGLEIKTVAPHGITQMYADGGKRIAVHFADPLYYNKVYPVSRVSTDKIFIDDFWPKDRRKHVFYEHKTAQLNASVPYEQGNANADFANATNVISVTSGQRLREYVASYTGNSKIISQQHISFQGTNQDTLVVSPNALPGNTSVSVGIEVIRQRPRLSSRYPVLTTVDHGKMMINGSTLEVETWNNSKALADNINKNMSLRNAFTLPNSEKFGLQFAMLKDPNTPVAEGVSANEISNYGPYVKDPELIKRLSDNRLNILGNISVSTGNETTVDSNFNQGSIKKGPDKGLVYVDDDGIQWVWSPAINQYRPVRLDDVYGTGGTTPPPIDDTEPTPPPEFNVDATEEMYIPDWEGVEQDVIDGTTNPEETFSYREGDLVLYDNTYWVAIVDINLLRNTEFTKIAKVTVGTTEVEIQQWKQISTQEELQSFYDSFLILKFVPGTGTTDSPIVPGNKLTRYNMRHESTYTIGSDDYTLPTFRLKPNVDNSFEVYQAVQNDDDDIYYILIDKSSPPLTAHDFYGTIASYSNFYNYPLTEYYYINDIIPSVDGNGKITNAKDPIRIKNTGKVVELGAVEPAGYVGKQLIPEPYAVSGGNGSDTVQNILSLTDIKIYQPEGGGPVRVEALTAGDDEFLMWTPGLTPGEWEPVASGPGPLPGRNATTVNFGFGRGYYAENDGHLPDDYPLIETGAYNVKMPRFKYSSKFSLNTTIYNYAVTTYFLDGEEITAERYTELLNSEPDVADRVVITNIPPGGVIKDGETDNWLTRDDANISYNDTTVVDMVRPEEIFVACFWTEPFLYVDQIINWDFTNLDANGYPTPVIGEYNGTVARCKYIRLTELPPNAVTRRLIPDTGWAGRGWNNRIVDNEEIDLTDDDPWVIFRPNAVSGGSTGDDDEGITPPLGIGTPETGTQPSGTYLVDPTGGLRPDLEPQPEIIPTTDAGPVLTGGFLNTLGGPCETPLPPASPEPTDTDAPCLTAKSFRRFKVYDNTSSAYKWGIDSVDAPENGTIGLIETKITGENPYRVFFNLIPDNAVAVDSIGIVIVQSKEEYPKVSGGDRDGLPVGLAQQRAKDWLENINTVFIKDTQWREGLAGVDGSQIGAYGVTPFDGDEVNNNAVTEGLGLPGDFSNNNAPTNATKAEDGSDILQKKVGGVQKLLIPGRNYNVDESGKLGLATDGLGFIANMFNCVNGEWVYVFIANDNTNADLGANIRDEIAWRLVIDHFPPITEEEEEENENGCSDEELASGSRNYIQGAELKEWGSVRNLAGGLGARHTPEWNYKNAFSDNIYFPYTAPGYQRYWDSAELGGRVRQITTDRTNSDKYAGSANTKLLRTSTVKEFNDVQLGSYYGASREGRTTEVKGYFRAPLTGWYSFSAIADDTLYMWMSGKVDADKTNSDRGHSDYSSSSASTYFARRNKKLVRSGHGLGHEGSGLNTGPTSLPALHFRGVDDMAPEGEYFTQDGYQLDGILPTGYGQYLDPTGPYLTTKAYHWDNCLIKTGWETTNHDRGFNSGDYQTLPRSIYLEQGKFYFTRIIWGNDEGPGYAKLRWRIVEGDGIGTTGKLAFSGRSCGDDDPAGNAGGNDDGGGGGGGGGGGCFTGHMKVTMADDTQKQIADIQIGDMVKSLNLETNELEDVAVQGIMKPRQCVIYELGLNNGTTIETTIDHPFRTSEGTWSTIDPNAEEMHVGISIDCGKLEVGTLLKGIESNVSITSITNTGRTETVHHLYDVGEHHNFFVEGMCVHNIHADEGYTEKK